MPPRRCATCIARSCSSGSTVPPIGVKPYAADSAFARDLKVMEDLGDKLLTTTLDQADVTALIRALRTVDKEPETAPAEAAPAVLPAAAAPVAAPPPKKEPEKPKGPPALSPSMGPSNVEDVIGRYSGAARMT